MKSSIVEKEKINKFATSLNLNVVQKIQLMAVMSFILDYAIPNKVWRLTSEQHTGEDGVYSFWAAQIKFGFLDKRIEEFERRLPNNATLMLKAFTDSKYIYEHKKYRLYVKYKSNKVPLFVIEDTIKNIYEHIKTKKLFVVFTYSKECFKDSFDAFVHQNEYINSEPTCGWLTECNSEIVSSNFDETNYGEFFSTHCLKYFYCGIKELNQKEAEDWIFETNIGAL
jgi:hypothetical protein